MEVDKEFLQNFVRMLDTLITMTRDKMVWQGLAVPFLGSDWENRFLAARANNQSLGEWEIYLADVKKMRDQAVAVLDQLQKGDPIQLPIDRVN